MRALTRAPTTRFERETVELAPGKRVRARGTGAVQAAPPRELADEDGAIETFGPYIVFEELGTGGMASVHRAEQRGLAGFRKPIALKRMLPEIASDDASVAAFTQEA